MITTFVLVGCIVALSAMVVLLWALRERDRREDELRVMFAHDRSFVEELQQPFCELGLHGVIREWNKDLAELTGYAGHEVLGTAFTEYLVEDEHTQQFVEHVRVLLERNRRVERSTRMRLEVRAASAAGFRCIPISVTLWSTTLPDERRVCVLVNDLSKENSMLHQKEAMLIRERNLVEKLRVADEEKTEFIATVSHELRTPLTSVVGYIEMLEDCYAGELNEKQRNMIAAINRNSVRLLALIDDVLTLSRIESKSVRMHVTRIHLADLCEGVKQALYPTMQQKALQLDVDIQGENPYFEGDFSQLERVLLNTVMNAAKFTAAGGRIKVICEENDTHVVIRICDSGIGIAPQELDRVTARFYRTSQSQENGVQGSGLGLAIVKSIVDRHGGFMHIESTVGKGTTVTISLPRIFSDSSSFIA